MTAPIASLARALHLLRVEMRQARAGSGGPSPTSRVPAGPMPADAKQSAVRALQGKLRAARAQSGGLSAGKALRLFVEAALVDEMGESLLLDPAFAELVERTCRAIEQDAGNAELLAAALAELEGLSASS